MTSSTPNEYQGQTANIKINIVSHVKQNYRGLDEAIKEDNLIRETQEELTDDLEKEYYVISDRVSTDCNLYPEYSSTGYTFDEITGQFTLDSYNLTDFSYQENFNDYVYNGTYSCQDGATTCNELYYQDNDGQCYKYTVTKEPTSTQGLWKNGDNYKFISPYNNILKYNNTTYHIDSIDADGYITLKESNAPQSLNWLDLTVSGIGTEDDPYVVYNG